MKVLGGIILDISSVFSIAFSVACALSLFIGIYTLYLNPHSKTNVLFFALTLALDVWAFGFSLAISADEIAAALFWRRFAAIGFGAFFAILLHFFLVFTGRKAAERKKWLYALLYLPTALVYLGFTYFPEINPEQYYLVSTPLGWINIAVNNAWDMFYVAYYFIYSIAGLYLLWRWGRNSSSPKDKKKSVLILVSFLATMLLASLTDMLGNFVFAVDIPQLAPVLMVFPALVIYYSIKKYGFLNPQHVDEDASLMSEQIRTKITNYMSNAFLFAAVLNVVVSYFLVENAELGGVLIFSGSVVFIGVVLQAIQRSVKLKNLKDILNTVVFSLIVPLLTLRNIDSAGGTIWAFPYILLIVTLVYGKGFIQISLTISILLTQVIVWIAKPEATVYINSADHVFRLGMFIIAIWFAHFAMQVLQSKLRENAEQIRFQQIITEISTEFISVNEWNLDKKIDAALSTLSSFLKPYRSCIYLFDENKENLTCLGRWFDHERTMDKGVNLDIGISNYPLITARVKAGNTTILSDVSDSLCETGDELPKLLGSYDRSFAAIPVINKNGVYGFFGIEAGRKVKKWPESQLSFFQIISNILADAFERIQQEKEITQMAYYDYLTKLPNRILLKDRTMQAINLAERTLKTFAIVFLDIDDFKTVNDTVGHDGGDALLMLVSEQLRDHLRKSDTMSRFGGDELVILLNNLTSTDDIPKIIEKLLNVFNKPFNLDDQEFFITASAGIAVYPYDGTDPDTLIKNADIAMYKSKEQGKNRYMFCTMDMKEEIFRKMKLTGSLFRALERHELQLHYQPQISMQSKEIIGVEALLRWFHPEFGVISPGLFIPMAENTGLIGPIGDWVLMTACLQCRTWHLKGLPDIRIAVNVSVLQLRNPGFVNRVRQVLVDAQLEPQYLELEVTESIAVSESDYIIEVLENLKKLGISIAIDDFGTEYSSLSRLSVMPIDRIKLDMQFVHSIGLSEKGNAIIKGIIGLAHTLGLKVIAEGVETKLQLDFLTERSSDEIQGFYFYRPLPPKELEEVLMQKHSGSGLVGFGGDTLTDIAGNTLNSF